MNKKGTIYVISNPAIPNMVKIGKTDNLERRIKELSSPSGIPLAFECVVAKTVNDMDFAEKKLHEAFASKRINPRREFFDIDEEELIALFELLEGEYATLSDAEIFESKEEKVAFEKLIKELELLPQSSKPEEIQTIVYSVGKDNGYEKNLREWFKLIYQVLFGEIDGPRMGFFISFFGVNETKELIKEKIK